MKTRKFTFMFFVIAFLTCNFSWGQAYQSDVLVTIDGIDYGPGIGIVSGTYTYHFNYHLTKDGQLERLHWNVTQSDLHNDSGDKVQIVDSGLDTYGIIWDFFNNPGYYNEGFPITYDVTDGWLDDVMPSEFPAEGKFINMSLKIQCKGTIIHWGSMMILNINANGELTVEVYRSF